MITVIFEDNVDFYFARQRVLEKLDEVRGSSIGDGVPLVELSDDARTAARLTEGLLAARWSRARTGILVVGPSACWFTPPDGDTCDLAQRDVLRRAIGGIGDCQIDAAKAIESRGHVVPIPDVPERVEEFRRFLDRP